MKSSLHTASNQDKLFIGLTAFVVFVFVCFFLIIKNNNHKVSQNNGLNINYEMAKVKSSEILYSLDGREIDRDNQELETATSAQNGKNQNTKNSKTNATVAKSSISKKATAAASTTPKKSAQQKTNQVPQYDLQDVKAAFDTDKKTVSNVAFNADSVQSHSNENVSDADQKTDDKKDVKTIEQWSKEIFAASDRSIILRFVTAFKNKEITDAEFYSVINKLLNSSDENKKGFGLYALRGTPSLNSFSTLVKIQKSLNPTYQAYVQETLLSYHQTNSLGYLHQALNSNQKLIVLKTIEIVKIGFTDIKNGTTSSLVDSRYRRDADFMTFAVQNYQSFLPQLTLLQTQSQQSGDHDVYAAAGQLTQAIQSTSVVASNF